MNEIIDKNQLPVQKEKYPEINADGFRWATEIGFGPSKQKSGEIGSDGVWIDGSDESLTLPAFYNNSTGKIELPDGTKIIAFGSPEVVAPDEFAKK